MPREPIPTWFFALVVVQQGDRFLLVHEAKHEQGWYLPAGRVEPGETLTEGAMRETLEETGVPVLLDGILCVEHSPRPEGTARLRVIFLAHPVTDMPPKSTADEESLGAAWFSLDALDDLPLRTPEVREILRHVHDGGPVYPVCLLAREGTV
jgi:phosphatase NudJ